MSNISPLSIAPSINTNDIKTPDYNNYKIEGIVSRTFKSPLFWTALPAISLIGFAVSALINGTLAIPSITLGAAAGFGLVTAGLVVFQWKQIRYEVSLIYTLAKHTLSTYDWWNEIKGYNIVLGAIPLENRDHRQLLCKNDIEAVLSMVEKYEINGNGILTEPVKQWGNGIIHKVIEAPDFDPVDLKFIDEAVNFIHQCHLKNKKVYVHCKAGRGRSATVVVCYLLKHHKNDFPTVKAAMDFVKSQRSQMSLNDQQHARVHEYHRLHCFF